jgi:TIR domain
MTTPKIFISYSHAEQDWAREFAASLVRHGLDVWFDEFNIKAGQLLSDALERGLRESDAVALLIDPTSMNRPNFFFEIGAALSMNKKIIPVVPEGFEAHKLPLSLRRIKFLVRKSPEETAKEMVTAIEVLYGEAA